MAQATPFRLRQAVAALRRGGVVAYPTEAVFGLGADPDDAVAVHRILAIKERPVTKGLILIADGFRALRPYIGPLDAALTERLTGSWPAPLTWLAPAASDAPPWITGGHDRIAVRVPAHPLARALCRAWGGALVSTSANLSGRRPARTALAVYRQLGRWVDYIVPGAVGGADKPTEIRDLRTGRVIRAGG